MQFYKLGPVCYAIAVKKEILRRHIQNLFSKTSFAREKQSQDLPNLVSCYDCGLIKRGKGIDLTLQQNKAENIRLACARIDGLVIHPGQVFSFWGTVGKTTRRKGYKDGRILIGGNLVSGLGGGLCNLGNTVHRLALHAPMTVTEFHKHSDALAPDHNNRIPFSSGTSVSYNYVDYRFRNDTDQDVQLRLWCENDRLYGQLRSQTPFPHQFHLEEEDHHFRKEGEKFYRISKIYKITTDRATGQVVSKELVLDNHSQVMYDYDQIPADQIRA